jgi:hypothetical protein
VLLLLSFSNGVSPIFYFVLESKKLLSLVAAFPRWEYLFFSFCVISANVDDD